jgi:DNA invertase Pin-like site-specific DNA recombinase
MTVVSSSVNNSTFYLDSIYVWKWFSNGSVNILAKTTLHAAPPCRPHAGILKLYTYRTVVLSRGQTKEFIMARENQFVTYYRVSTVRQGLSGLGLDAQRQTVTQYLSGSTRTVLNEFVEVETGKGANALDRRPQLRAALELCKKSGATLLIAKLDRLARNVHFVSGLMESKVKFVACDLPEANQLTIHIMAAFAEHEARRISERTRDALAAAKARGVVLGATGPANLKRHTKERQDTAKVFNARLMPLLNGFAVQGMTRRAMVVQLNDLGIKAPRGGVWSLGQVQRLVGLRISNTADGTQPNGLHKAPQHSHLATRIGSGLVIVSLVAQ